MSTYRYLNMCNIYSNTLTLFYISGPFGLGRLSFSGSLSLGLGIGSTDLSWFLFINLVLDDTMRCRLHPEQNSYKWLSEVWNYSLWCGWELEQLMVKLLTLPLLSPSRLFVCVVNWLSEMVPVVLSHVPCFWGSGYSHGSYLSIRRVFADAWSQFWQFKLEG